MITFGLLFLCLIAKIEGRECGRVQRTYNILVYIDVHHLKNGKKCMKLLDPSVGGYGGMSAIIKSASCVNGIRDKPSEVFDDAVHRRRPWCYIDEERKQWEYCDWHAVKYIKLNVVY